MKSLALSPLVGLFLCLSIAAQAQTPIQLGETGIPGIADCCNANLLAAQGPYGLTQAATIQSLSFYSTTSGGHLRLGIYDASGPNGGPGSLKAQTASFTPGSNRWNMMNVVTQVALPTGNYWLAFVPSSNSLGFRKGITQGVSEKNYGFTFGSLPATFSTNPSGDQYHWGLYATLLPAPSRTLQLTFNPPSPSVVSTAPVGTVITQAVASWSDGSPFIGQYTFSSPYFADGGLVAFDGTHDVVVNGDLSGLVGMDQNFTVTATQ